MVPACKNNVDLYSIFIVTHRKGAEACITVLGLLANNTIPATS